MRMTISREMPLSNKAADMGTRSISTPETGEEIAQMVLQKSLPRMAYYKISHSNAAPRVFKSDYAHPKVDAAAAMIGITEKYKAIFFSSPPELSANAVFTIGFAALKTPSNSLLSTRPVNVLDSPKQVIAAASPAEFASSTRLRPALSLYRPQKSTAMAVVRCPIES